MIPIMAAADRRRRLGHRHRSSAFKRWTLLAIGAISTCAALSPSIEFMDITAVSSKPVVEILFPPNDYLLMTTDLQIEIAMRTHLLNTPVRDERVCISMATVFVPVDAQADANSGFAEQCYERHGNDTTFHASGLLPGLHYGVSVGLINAGKMLGYSSRYFQVASIVVQVDGGAATHRSIAEAMRTAESLHLHDQWALASVVYHKVLEMFPAHAVARHRLAQAAMQERRFADAVHLMQHALSLHDHDETMHLTMGRCLVELDKTELAIQHYRRALELRPSYVAAALALGIAWQSLGKYDDALHELRKVVASDDGASHPRQIAEPPHSSMVEDAWAWLCELTRQSDSWHEADRCLAHAIQRFPTTPRFYLDRGNLLLSGGQFEVAQKEFEASANLGSVQAMIHSADVLESLGEYESSIERYAAIYHDASITSSSTRNQVVIMMSIVLPRILPASQQAIDAERERVLNNVTNVLQSLDQPMQAIPIDPSHPILSTAVSLNTHHRNNRELKRAIGTMYHKLLIDPGIVQERFLASYGVTPLPFRQDLNLRGISDTARLRVGFVSRFLYSPAVGLFMDELLPQLNRSMYEVFAFGIGLSKSIRSYEQAEQIAEHVVALPREMRTARAEIRAANLDLLIYPELGMDKMAYFLSFQRLARVQAAWWGNPDTTGVPNIDYFLASEYEHKSFRDHYTESVYQMQGMGIYHELPPLPNSTIAREDIRKAIVDKFPVPKDFHFYLTIEAILHLHPDFDEALRQILERDPLAYVFLLTSSNRRHWKQLLIKRITDHVGHENAVRVICLVDVDTRHEMHLLNAADAVLSSIHLSRPKTAMQAFAAGVPVVTMAGELWASRIVAGFYKQMGISELTTTTIEEYAQLAVQLATDDSFRVRMTRKVRRRRHRLSHDRKAVSEWETFFDMVASPPRESTATEARTHTAKQTPSFQPSLAERASTIDTASMTCPATTLQHLW